MYHTTNALVDFVGRDWRRESSVHCCTENHRLWSCHDQYEFLCASLRFINSSHSATWNIIMVVNCTFNIKYISLERNISVDVRCICNIILFVQHTAAWKLLSIRGGPSIFLATDCAFLHLVIVSVAAVAHCDCTSVRNTLSVSRCWGWGGVVTRWQCARRYQGGETTRFHLVPVPPARQPCVPCSRCASDH